MTLAAPWALFGLLLLPVLWWILRRARQPDVRELPTLMFLLEEELGLPFSFVSGHIHELQIHVPWTRLNAEPIVITINTIGNERNAPLGI